MSAPASIPGFHAIVLAAGAGRRFGGRKLLAPWRGAPLIQAAVQSACSAPVETVTVVLGADAAAVRSAVERRDRSCPVVFVEALEWSSGLSASLRAGVAALPAGAQAVYVFLGDMPCIPASILAPLAAAVLAGAPAAAPIHQGRRGHPVLLSRALLDQIDTLTGDEGARRLLDGVRVAEIPHASDAVLFDVDGPDALR
jgi:molybdenum cofactor cytidylyltransferase